MHRLQSKRFEVSDILQEKWSTFLVSLDEAAKTHLHKERMAIPAFYAHDIPGADNEIDNALRKIDLKEDERAEAFFHQESPSRKLYIEVRY